MTTRMALIVETTMAVAMARTKVEVAEANPFHIRHQGCNFGHVSYHE
jgi:hypothetical protein